MTDIAKRLRDAAAFRFDEDLADCAREAADEIERLRSWIYEVLNSLGDPQDACDHNNSEEAALRATIDEAIGKLRTGINEQER